MKRLHATLILTLAIGTAAWAQTPSKNTAFQSGETLRYDLFFNWKFVWVKAGTASMNTTRTTYKGKPAYRSYLITRGSASADKFFIMRDTLVSYFSEDIVPYYYRKGATEGKSYRLNEVWYDYPGNNRCHMKMLYRKNQDEPQLKQVNAPQQAYDMISMLMRARSFDPSGYKPGHRIKFLMADGHNCEYQHILYRGKKKFRVENSSTTYRCLVFSFMETENGKEKEIVRFYITDDANHIPVRLDLNLSFGTAKAYLTGATGLRNPQTSKVK